MAWTNTNPVSIGGATKKSDYDKVFDNTKEAAKFSKEFIFLSPTAVVRIGWRASFACKVTAVYGYRVGGTGAVVNARKNGTSDHLASDLSLTSADTWMNGGSVQNDTYAAGDRLEFEVVSVDGSPAQVAIQVEFERT